MLIKRTANGTELDLSLPIFIYLLVDPVNFVSPATAVRYLALKLKNDLTNQFFFVFFN